MAFQYQGGNLMRGAALQNQQQQSFFDNIARGIRNYQIGEDREMRKKQIEMEQLEKASDPKALADSGMMKAAQGINPTPQEAAAMKVWQAKQRPTFDPNTGQMMGAPNIFDSLSPSFVENKPQSGNWSGSTPQDNTKAMQGFDFDQLSGLENNPKAKQVFIEETVKNAVKNKGKKEEQLGARKEFDTALQSVLEDLDALKDAGGVVTADQNAFKNALDYIANTREIDPLGVLPAGQDLGRIWGTRGQELRDKIEGKVPKLFNAIKKASGLTGTELNSKYEVENQLKQLGLPTMSYEARIDLLRDLSDTFGTGSLRDYGKNKQDKKNFNTIEENKASGKQNPANKPKITKEQALEILKQRGLYK